MSFVRRKISLLFALASPQVPGASTGDQLIASGLRVSCNITNTGAQASVATIRVYGLSLPIMNRLATLGKPGDAATHDRITISAGDDNGMSAVFAGGIMEAFVDLNESPNSVLSIKATSASLLQYTTLLPSSFSGTVNVVDVLSYLAAQSGQSIQNSGVTGTMESPYLWGSAADQFNAICEHAGINHEPNGMNTIAIWPVGGVRDGSTPLISAATGMIGYPRYSATNKISVDTMFNPQISVGTDIQVQSIIRGACGDWNVLSVTHTLEAEVPGGAWLSHLECVSYKPFQNQADQAAAKAAGVWVQP